MYQHIRLAQQEDLAQIVAIYNQAILKKGLTADLDLQQVEDKKNWFLNHTPERYPIFVALHETQVIAWISLSPYREGRRALQSTTEVSLYVDEAYLGKGIGSAMMQHVLVAAKDLAYKNIVAILIEANEKSVGLFTKFKFERWGLLPGIVEIDTQQLNHCIYGRKL